MTIANLLKLDDSGVKVADYADILTDLTNSFKGIYGADAQVGASTKDGQWLASLALAIHDTGSMAASVYNNMNPNTATGDPFDRQLALLGLNRKAPTQSAIYLGINVTESAKNNNTKFGKVILTEPTNPGVTWVWDGILPLPNSQFWTRNSSPSGVFYNTAVIAYASTIGPIPATSKAGDELQIISVENKRQDILKVIAGSIVMSTDPNGKEVTLYIDPVQYTVGNELESVDAAKIRRAKSYANNANSVVRALEGKLATLPGVQDARVYENATDTRAPVTPVAFMLQERNSILCLIRSPYVGIVNPSASSVAIAVANTIDAKKSGGCGLSVGIGNIDSGKPITVGKIKFLLAQPISLGISLDIITSTSWSTSLELLIRAAVTKYVGEVSLGQVVYEPDITCVVKNVIESNGGGGAIAGASFTVDNVVTDRWNGSQYFYGYPSPTITFRTR